MNEVMVSKGQIIPKGGIIGTSGCSGNAARIQRARFHIHIEAGTQPKNKNIDPINLIRTEIQ
jgi:murein DD-endopeptidase MepM/ murein hydrolase activator NlpD